MIITSNFKPMIMIPKILANFKWSFHGYVSESSSRKLNQINQRNLFIKEMKWQALRISTS